MALPGALLLDLDGTLYTDAGPIPGAVAAIAALRRRGVPLRFVTNTTRRSRAALVERLRGYGFAVEPQEMFTSVLAGVRVLQERGARLIAPFVAPGTLEDLRAFELAGGTAGGKPTQVPDAVVVGDLGDRWTPALLNEAFRYVLDGAVLVALQKDRYWLGPTGLELDAGPYVAALEYATGIEAVVCGKPQPGFYRAAWESLGLEAGARGAMVGDDLWADVAGAQQAGLEGWLVRTGKFRDDVLARSGIRPDRLLTSVAALADL
jgi:HAD superfamily hydrolase (TIGR01458 family)